MSTSNSSITKPVNKAKVVKFTPAATGADKTAQKLKAKYPKAAKPGIVAVVEAYSTKNKEKNQHPFAKAAHAIRDKFLRRNP